MTSANEAEPARACVQAASELKQIAEEIVSAVPGQVRTYGANVQADEQIQLIAHEQRFNYPALTAESVYLRDNARNKIIADTIKKLKAAQELTNRSIAIARVQEKLSHLDKRELVGSVDEAHRAPLHELAETIKAALDTMRNTDMIPAAQRQAWQDAFSRSDKALHTCIPK